MNSSFSICNSIQWSQLLAECATGMQRSRNRALFITCSAPPLGMGWFAEEINSDYFPPNPTADRSDQISSLLGTERCSLIFCVGARLDTGLLAAAAGTIAAGGFLILDISASQRVNFESPVHEGKRSESLTQSTGNSQRSLDRLIRLLRNSHEQHADTVRFIDLTNYVSTPTVEADKTQRPLNRTTLCCTNGSIANSMASREQNELLEKTCQHLFSNFETCTLIKGRRGRGKSALLGRIAHTLKARQANFKVTALHKFALSSFEHHGGTLDTHFLGSQNELMGDADTILVDEAASLSIAQLENYLTFYKHVVLCTTTEGYEAAGRALDVRLLNSLQRTRKKVLLVEPKQPWRWGNNDPLEGFIDQLLLKNINKHYAHHPVNDRGSEKAVQAVQHCQIEQISQERLANNEALLESLHSLLDSTHYQSTTKDLPLLLDAPNLQIWVQHDKGRICAALLAQREGNLPDSLHNDIVDKKRRLPNQLLPQLLSQMADSTQALGRHYLRVVRIAVLPSLRRQKLASRLLNAVINSNTTGKRSVVPASADQLSSPTTIPIDAIGASFASDADSVSFWKYHGFAEFHRGFRANPRSGLTATAVMRSFETSTAHVLEEARQIHTENTRTRCAMESGVIASNDTTAFSERHIRHLERFAARERSMHDCITALHQLSARANISMIKRENESQRQFEKNLRVRVKQFIQKHDFTNLPP